MNKKQNTTVIRDSDYKVWISELKKRFKSSQIKAAVKVNSELIRFYWSLGRDIVQKKAESKWGSGFFDILSRDLREEFPAVKGFSVTNLRYIKRFYQCFSIHPQLGGELVEDLSRIPWGHTKYIIDRCHGNAEKAFFFVQKSLTNNWSRSVLLNFLDTELFERQGKVVSNFSQNLPLPQGDLAQQLMKDPYNFDFISVTEHYEEKELKDALIHNIEKFLLELGRGFAYMGREFRLQIGNTEKFMDMLFYNTNLHCYVVVEVKTTEFDSENIGQLGTYVTAVNHILKRDGDNPTVGLLICKTKDNVLAQYALESMAVPIGISEYELSKLYPADFRSGMPSIEEIESKLV